MDSYKSKRVLWLCFWCQTLFLSDLCLKHVYILIFGIKFFSNFSKGPPYDLGNFSFFRKNKNLKNPKNHRGDPLKNSKFFLFQKSKCTHVSSINLKGKVSHSKNIVTAVIYFWEFPYGSPCSWSTYYLLLLHTSNSYYNYLENGNTWTELIF